MMKDFSIYKCGFLLVFFALAVSSVFTQDLGSNNKLFDPSSPNKNTKTEITERCHHNGWTTFTENCGNCGKTESVKKRI